MATATPQLPTPRRRQPVPEQRVGRRVRSSPDAVYSAMLKGRLARRGLIYPALWLMIVLVSRSAQSAEPSITMLFDANPPMQPTEILGTAWWIYADGVINSGAPQRFAKLMETKRIPDASLMFLNSPGGSLFAGMELGRLIRRYRLQTYVGAKGEGPYKSKSGICLSACALTFLGGSFRYLSQGAYGVHRFYSMTTGALGSDEAQIVSAAVIQYIRDMGVDPTLFTEMTQAGKDEMHVIPESKLLALGVVNNGVGRTTWTIEAAGNTGLYMKGHREIVWGEQKLILMCAAKNAKNVGLIAAAIFDPQGRQAEVARMSAISLEIDGKPTPMSNDRVVMKPTDMNGWINVEVALDSQLVSRLMTARTVGLMAQYAFEAPMFAGISEMDFTEGAKKLPGFLAACH